MDRPRHAAGRSSVLDPSVAMVSFGSIGQSHTTHSSGHITTHVTAAHKKAVTDALLAVTPHTAWDQGEYGLKRFLAHLSKQWSEFGSFTNDEQQSIAHGIVHAIRATAPDDDALTDRLTWAATSCMERDYGHIDDVAHALIGAIPATPTAVSRAVPSLISYAKIPSSTYRSAKDHAGRMICAIIPVVRSWWSVAPQDTARLVAACDLTDTRLSSRMASHLPVFEELDAELASIMRGASPAMQAAMRTQSMACGKATATTVDAWSHTVTPAWFKAVENLSAQDPTIIGRCLLTDVNSLYNNSDIDRLIHVSAAALSTDVGWSSACTAYLKPTMTHAQGTFMLRAANTYQRRMEVLDAIQHAIPTNGRGAMQHQQGKSRTSAVDAPGYALDDVNLATWMDITGPLRESDDTVRLVAQLLSKPVRTLGQNSDVSQRFLAAIVRHHAKDQRVLDAVLAEPHVGWQHAAHGTIMTHVFPDNRDILTLASYAVSKRPKPESIAAMSDHGRQILTGVIMMDIVNGATDGRGKVWMAALNAATA